MIDSSHYDYDKAPAHLRSLLRHFADLRDGNHGHCATSRTDKELLFNAAVGYLSTYARQALAELNETLLLGTGTIASTGIIRSPSGDMAAFWRLE
jgi:hypothetical protein